jgi:hypothetical protein
MLHPAIYIAKGMINKKLGIVTEEGRPKASPPSAAKIRQRNDDERNKSGTGKM